MLYEVITADDQTPNKEAIQKLVTVIMRAVWRGAGNDSLAQQELEQEEEARRTHYALLEYPRITSYNVCYTKLLRSGLTWSGSWISR